VTQNSKKRTRIIARLDIKNTNLIKGVQLEGLRVLGRAQDYAKSYYEAGIDEIIYIDQVASLYDREYLVDLIKQTAKEVFVPITVAGGIKSIDDVDQILRAGADKVAINSSAVKRPELIKEVSEYFGSQAIVAQLDIKLTDKGYEVYIDSGREKTGILAKDWVKEVQELGCGEIFLTSIDKDGSCRGFEKPLIEELSPLIKAPFIISGGMSCVQDLSIVDEIPGIDAVAIASMLHYKKLSVADLKAYYNNV
jgi:imidazole glycerol-phosphate synthase subunit HisF